jgi:hypothetical protein
VNRVVVGGVINNKRVVVVGGVIKFENEQTCGWCVHVFVCVLFREREIWKFFFGWEQMTIFQLNPSNLEEKFTKMPFRPIDLKMRLI